PHSRAAIFLPPAGTTQTRPPVRNATRPGMREHVHSGSNTAAVWCEGPTEGRGNNPGTFFFPSLHAHSSYKLVLLRSSDTSGPGYGRQPASCPCKDRCVTCSG